MAEYQKVNARVIRKVIHPGWGGENQVRLDIDTGGAGTTTAHIYCPTWHVFADLEEGAKLKVIFEQPPSE